MSSNILNMNNLSSTNTAENQNISTTPLTAIQIACYSVIIITGTIGNLLLIIAIARTRNLKTSQYLILNLATVDFLTCTVSIPLDIIILIIRRWPFGAILCKLIYPLQTVFMAVSVSTLLCMALERYRVIIHPLKPKISGKMILLVITLLWAVSIGLVSPYGAALNMKTEDVCVESWPNNDMSWPKAFTLSVFLVLYMVPLFAISITYTRIGLRLRAQSREPVCFVGTKNLRDSSKYRAKQNIRIVEFFVIAVIVFAICLLPFQVMWMWSDFGNGRDWKHFNTLLTFANVMVYANSAINPFIFGAIGRRYSSCNCFYRQGRRRAINTPMRCNVLRFTRKPSRKQIAPCLPPPPQRRQSLADTDDKEVIRPFSQNNASLVAFVSAV